MKHITSSEDDTFVLDFEGGRSPPSAFTHRAHLRLAYCYLTRMDTEQTAEKVKQSLLSFLETNGVPLGKFHETLTLSWVKAVRHFMDRSSGANSFDAFISESAELLDTEIMLSHYSRETLFSDDARVAFIEPDLQAIPAPV